MSRPVCNATQGGLFRSQSIYILWSRTWHLDRVVLQQGGKVEKSSTFLIIYHRYTKQNENRHVNVHSSLGVNWLVCKGIVTLPSYKVHIEYRMRFSSIYMTLHPP